MKRFIALIALTGVVGVSFGAVPQSSSETGYIPKSTLKFIKSPQIPPGYTLKLLNLEWISWANESDVPCHILFPEGGTTYSIECAGVSYSLQGDLRNMPPGRGKEYIVRIKNKE